MLLILRSARALFCGLIRRGRRLLNPILNPSFFAVLWPNREPAARCEIINRGIHDAEMAGCPKPRKKWQPSPGSEARKSRRRVAEAIKPGGISRHARSRDGARVQFADV